MSVFAPIKKQEKSIPVAQYARAENKPDEAAKPAVPAEAPAKPKSD